MVERLAVPPDPAWMITGAFGIGGGLVLTFLGTVRLYRRLKRVVNLLTIGDWKTDVEIWSETELAQKRSASKSRLTTAELAALDGRLAPRPATTKRGTASTSGARSDDAYAPDP